jgi:transposase-like protein
LGPVNKEVNPTIKGRIHIDEKYIKVNKKHCFDLNAIDHKTKYVLAHLFVEKRTPEKCVEFLREIKNSCYEQILERRKNKNKIVFVSGKFGCYKIAFNKLFFHVAKLVFGVPIKLKNKGLKHNNNPIERYNQTIEDRIKTMRNFSSFSRATHFLNLRRIIYNFVNPHMQLKGLTPAEKANINLDLGRNKILNLIKKQGQKTHHSQR